MKCQFFWKTFKPFTDQFVLIGKNRHYLVMKLVKYVKLMSTLSSIDGRKSSVKGQLNFSTKLYLRGDLNEVDYKKQSDAYTHEIRTLDLMKRSALRQYAMAAWCSQFNFEVCIRALETKKPYSSPGKVFLCFSSLGINLRSRNLGVSRSF